MAQTFVSPLAAKMRPKQLAEVIGQDHLTQPGSVLSMLAKSSGSDGPLTSQSILLWGPPGTGKTTIALNVAKNSGRFFIELNAVSSGVKEVREAISLAKKENDTYGRGTIVFIDEIHRFNKSQQDALLAEVEAGTFVLIAATTENPSFAVNGPLLSRCILLELNPLSEIHLTEILKRAIESVEGFAGEFEADEGVLSAIASLAAGDARRALILLEQCVAKVSLTGEKLITKPILESVAKNAALHYDKNGDQHYDVISAFIKSIRGSDVDASLHYLARMIEAGEDPRFIARRLMVSAAEDVGLADPQALVLATSAAQSVALIGMPEARIALGEVTIYLALAPKSNSAYLAINAAIDDVRAGFSEPIPVHLRNQYPARLKGASYKYPHDEPNAIVSQDYLGPKVSKRNYYKGKLFGFEERLTSRWLTLKKLIRGD